MIVFRRDAEKKREKTDKKFFSRKVREVRKEK